MTDSILELSEAVLSAPPTTREPIIALGMMVKNEEQVMAKTLESALNSVDVVYIYDTGSTDNTIEVCKETCKTFSKPVYIRQGEFVNFAVSRNALLEWMDADPTIDFMLLLDANDEFHSPNDALRVFARDRLSRPDDDEGGFYIQQRWMYGEAVETYFNIFFIRPRRGWIYHGPVHEYLAPRGDLTMLKVPERCPSDIYISQNRNENCERSFERYRRDYDIFMAELAKNTDDGRTLFYMGQTCECLQLYNEAFHYYTLRIQIPHKIQGRPEEEIYQSHYRLGNLCIRLGKPHDETVKHYSTAIEYAQRVEPMLRLCEYYLFVRGQPLVAYGYACMALFSPYPTSSLLFKVENDYAYRRYNRFMVTANLVGDYARACEVGRQMVTSGIALESDIENLEVVTANLTLASEGSAASIVHRRPTKLNDNCLKI